LRLSMNQSRFSWTEVLTQTLLTSAILGAAFVVLRVLAITKYDPDSALAVLNAFNPSDIVKLLLGMVVVGWSVLIVFVGVTGVMFFIVALTREPANQEPLTYVVAIGLTAASFWFGTLWVRVFLVGLVLISLIVVLMLRFESPLNATLTLMGIAAGIAVIAIGLIGQRNGVPVWRSIHFSLGVPGPLLWILALFLLLLSVFGLGIRASFRRQSSDRTTNEPRFSHSVSLPPPPPPPPPPVIPADYYAWIRERPNRFFDTGVGVGFFAAALLAFVIAAFSPVPWVQPEQITSSSFKGSGYLLGNSNGWSTFLSYDERTVHLIKNDTITARLICQPKRKSKIEIHGYAMQPRDIEVSGWTIELPLIARDPSRSIVVDDSNSKPDPTIQTPC
jgi:hypothetical protein